jgi:hypothetical protein
MHQGILARAADHPDVVLDVPLRFIRSSSAPLSPSVLAALEETFRAPVVEAYGMTEAAHQIASNPLRSGPRKPGSVGLPAGPDIAIMAASGELLPSGSTGEVVIRGPNVASGYHANDAANAEALRDGWFRTGDLGSIDEDGYLRLTGRLKEMINRGGEKISPREVDEVLLGHPGVRQALSFAIPHAQLGEEIGAAVELEPGANLQASELRAWARTRLPAFKVPRIIRVVDEIHRGPTGKFQRAGLAARLGIEPLDDSGLEAVFVPPRTPTEASVAAVWRSLFPRQEIGVRTRFGGLGGDSLLAVQMLAEVSDRAGFDVPHVRFVEEGTIEALAADIDARDTLEDSPLVPFSLMARVLPSIASPATTASCSDSSASPTPSLPTSPSGPWISGGSAPPPPWRISPHGVLIFFSPTTRTARTASPVSASAASSPPRSPAISNPAAGAWSPLLSSTRSIPHGDAPCRAPPPRAPASLSFVRKPATTPPGSAP